MSEEVAVYGRRGFALQPANMSEALEMAKVLAKSQMIPTAYRGKPEDTLVAMMLGCELGLNPIQALQNIAVINGKPSIFGDALVALMLNHPSYGGMEESFDEATNTATCTVWRKGGPRHAQSFSEADAKLAGLWGKRGHNGLPTPWVTYPKRMLQMRARAFAIRAQFADALAGLITREEAEDMPVEAIERNITPIPEQREPEPMPEYPQVMFDAGFPKWEAAILNGITTPANKIAQIGTKYALTKAQIDAINRIGQMERAKASEFDAVVDARFAEVANAGAE